MILKAKKRLAIVIISERADMLAAGSPARL